ncbi:initiation factor 4F subunit [Actinidia rufa]|uniref:Initiation factor 4F subunit n=1 Tax=Actinidia rufa TaxID=165716 RepID=A0A7J0GD37_9ERIC|nr:initiation factor 4F subunit [Actinidia rufa]
MELAGGVWGIKLDYPFQNKFRKFSHTSPKIAKRNASFAATLRMVSNGSVGRSRKNYVNSQRIYTRLDSCLVIPPLNRKKPRAIVKFLGGAFIGAVPEVTYSYLLELLANEDYLIISVPYDVTFDHAQAAREIYERFNACFDRLSTCGLPSANLTATEFANLPLYSVGHR